MAIWNSLVRGNVISIQNAGQYDPMVIIGDSNPMPTPDNPNGFGDFKKVTPNEPNDPYSYPQMDATPKSRGANGSDPFAGMGD